MGVNTPYLEVSRIIHSEGELSPKSQIHQAVNDILGFQESIVLLPIFPIEFLNFQSDPRYTSAERLANRYGFYAIPDNAEIYPLCLFLNHDTQEYMLYSDSMKKFWDIEYDKKIKITHPLETIKLRGGTLFEYTSLRSTNIYDDRFQKRALIGENGEYIGDTILHLPFFDENIPGIPIYH